MNRKKEYKDMDKFKKTRNAQRKRYYKKTQLYKRKCWNIKEDILVLKHEITDTELSYMIHRSVSAIQKRRCRLKDKINKGELLWDGKTLRPNLEG